MTSPDPKKRTASSCDYCRQHKAKCSRLGEGSCRRCLKAGRSCVISNTRTGRPYYQTSKEQYDLMTSLVRYFLPDASLEKERLRELVAELNPNGISRATDLPASPPISVPVDPNDLQIRGLSAPSPVDDGTSPISTDLTAEFYSNSVTTSSQNGLALNVSHSVGGVVSPNNMNTAGSTSAIGLDGNAPSQPTNVLQPGPRASAEQAMDPVPQVSNTSETFPVQSVPRRDAAMQITRYDNGSSWPAFFSRIHSTVGQQYGNLFRRPPFLLDEMTESQQLELVYADNLPSRTEFEQASVRFFAEINCVNYILSYEEFHTYVVMVYDQIRPISHAVLMLLCLILSFDKNYQEYYYTACQHIEFVLQEGSLASVQALMLATLCRLNRDERNFAWVTLGSASRVAQSLGLHLNEACWDEKSPAVIENRKRLWWSLYDLELCLACRLGRSPGIDHTNFSVSLPSETMFNVIPYCPPDYHKATYRLSKLTGQVIQDLYGPRSAHIALDNRAGELLDELGHFWEELPSHLKPDVQTAPSHSRAILYLGLRYYYTILLVTRPSVVSFWSNPAASSPQLLHRVELCESASKQSLLLLKRMNQNNLLSRQNFLDASYILANMIIFILRLVKDPSIELFGEAEECMQILNYTQHLIIGRVTKRNFEATIQELKSMLDMQGPARDVENLSIDELLRGLFGADEYMWPADSNVPWSGPAP